MTLYYKVKKLGVGGVTPSIHSPALSSPFTQSVIVFCQVCLPEALTGSQMLKGPAIFFSHLEVFVSFFFFLVGFFSYRKHTRKEKKEERRRKFGGCSSPRSPLLLL